MVLSQRQWRVGALTSRVWLHPRRWAQLTASHLLTQAITLPHSQSSRPEKAFELASPTLSRTLARKGIRGRLLAWLEDYSSTVGPEFKFKWPQIIATRNWRRDAPVADPQPRSVQPLMEELVALPFQAGHVLLSTPTTWPSLSPGRGGEGFARRQRALDLITAKLRELGPARSRRRSPGHDIKAANPGRKLRVRASAWHGRTIPVPGVWLDRLAVRSRRSLTTGRERNAGHG
ncbi:hypothetical protein GWK47_037354 [Chionoecetes opilio]|uniref:Uncharacterized protein n=1 Tax=Chionoecetes opilio TaxID=41210 RepID=A0A8J5D1G5_CHIOP|nr:hypothetical protein GWK47_037354 [Chionoecetes opilio]